MKYGIRNTILREPDETVFSVASSIGLDGVEYCIGRDYADSLLWRAGGVDQLRSLADRAEIEVSSLSPGVFASCNPSLPDETKRAEGREILSHVIKVCSRMDVHDILVPMFPRDIDQWLPERWDLMVEGFKVLAGIAEEHSVNLVLETTFSAEQLLTIIDRVGSDRIKVYYDTANQTNSGFDVPAELRLLDGEVGMVHVKDTDGEMLGDGRVDFDGVDAALQDIGYSGYIVLETPSPKGSDPKANAVKNFAFARKLGMR